MNVTPLISRTGTAPHASPARPSDTSPADFLLGTSPASAAPDFKAIAASWFDNARPTPDKTQDATKDAGAVTNPAAGQSDDRPETRNSKGKDTSDPASELAAHPELTIPLFSAPEPLLPSVPTPGGPSETPGLPQIGARLDQEVAVLGLAVVGLVSGSAVPGRAVPGSVAPGSVAPGSVAPGSVAPGSSESAGKERSANGQTPSELGAESDRRLALSGSTSQIHGLSAIKQQDSQTSAAVAGDGWNEIASRPDKNRASNQPPTTGDGVKPAKQPTSSANASVTPAPSGPQPPFTLALEPTADASASRAAAIASGKETLKAPIAEKNVAQSESATPGRVARSKSVSSRTPASGLPKVKDRDSKDTATALGQAGKPADTRVGQIGEGSTNSATGNGKDVLGLAVPQSGAHGKPASLKQMADASSSAAAPADGDTPDEGLPTATSSPVTTAKLVQSMNTSEFRVGIQTREFGTIDIRTSVARHLFSAQISVEHGDMAKSLTTDLPALYHKLADQQVSVANIVIQGQGLATSSGLAQDAQPQNWRPQNHGDENSNPESVLPAMLEQFDSTGRLDIRI